MTILNNTRILRAAVWGTVCTAKQSLYTDEDLKWDTPPFRGVPFITVALESLVGRSASLEASHYKSSRV